VEFSTLTGGSLGSCAALQ